MRLLLCCSAPSSLGAVKFWTSELRQHLGKCCITVAANKVDLLLATAAQQQQERSQQQQPQTQEAAASPCADGGDGTRGAVGHDANADSATRSGQAEDSAVAHVLRGLEVAKLFSS